MTMLPDVDEQGWGDWLSQRFREETDSKIASLANVAQVGDRLADLTRLATTISAPPPEAPTAPPAPEPTPEPTPAPAAPPPFTPEAQTPEPPVAPRPPTSAPEQPLAPEPAASAPEPTFAPPLAAAPTAPSPPPTPTPAPLATAAAPAPPAAAPSDWQNQVFGQALGAVSRAGGDVQAFADRFGQGLSSAQDAQSAFGQALGAASAAGADVQAFADTFRPPEPPPPSLPISPPSPGGGGGGPLQDYARQAAQRAGIDPDLFTRQIQQESGFNPNAGSPAGARGIAQIVPKFHPGVDPNDPYASLDYAANLMKSNLGKYGGDYAKALAAYNAGGGAVDKYGGVPPFEETQRYVSTILGGTNLPRTATPAEGIGRAGGALGQANRDISQFGDPQLTNDEAYAACGPAAAVRFAQKFGRNPTLREATDLAASVGWTTGQGMAGLGSEQALMTKLGVPTKLVNGPDWGTFANEAKTGNPVTISTQGHYFTADGWDPTTNRFHVGRSGLDLKGGAEWMTPEQMTALMGPVQGGLLADNPQVPAPSVADQETNPLGWLDRAKKSMADSLGATGNVLQQGIIEPLRGALSLESTPDPHDVALARLDASVTQAANPSSSQGLVDTGNIEPSPLTGLARVQSDLARLTDTSNRPLSPGAPLREAIANAPVLGGALGMARGPLLPSDQELIDTASPQQLDVARQLARLGRAPGVEPSESDIAEALRGSRIGEAVAMAGEPGGVARVGRAPEEVVTGSGVLQRAYNALETYPEEVATQVRQWAQSMDAPQSTIGSTLLRWIEENPPSSMVAGEAGPAGTVRAAGQQAVRDLTAAIGGRGPSMPGGAQPGQMFLEGGLPMGGPSPPPGGVRGPAMAAPEINLPGYVTDSVKRIIGNSWDEMSAAAQGARTGKVEPAVLDDLATAAKTTADRAKAVLRLDDPANSETAYALRQALDDQAARVNSAQQALRDTPDSVDARNALVREIAGQRALQETVAGIEPKAGRALEQFRPDQELAKMAERFKMSPDEFARHLADKANFADPTDVADFAQKAYGYTFKDKAMAVYYFNLLSNPLTHIRNAVGNTAAMLTAPVERAGAAAFDPLARKLVGDTGPRQRYIQEAPAEYAGMASSLMDGARQGLRRLTLGVSDRPTVSELTGPIGEAFGGGLKNPLNVPGRALAASDDFFRGMNEGAAQHGLANRVARQEGLTGEALTNRIAELIKHPDENMLDEIAKVGEYRVFQQPNVWADRINKAFRTDTTAGRLLVPFLKTPLNLMGYAMERSPLGGVSILSDLAKAKINPGAAQKLAERGAGDLADRMSRAVIGSTVWAALAKEAFDGNLTGKTPTDPTERDAFLREGKQPNSFRSPTDGKWYSYLPLSPYSTLFSAAANVADAWRKGQIDNPDDVSKLGLNVAYAFVHGMADTQWTQQLTDVLDIANGGVHDPGDAINKFATRQAANISPGILRSFARATDQTLRDPQNPVEGVLAGIPGAQSMVRSQLNAWGQPIERPTGGIEAMLNPLNPSAPTIEPDMPETFDPVEKELRRLQDFHLPDFSVEPSMVGKDVSVLGQDVEMTEPQQRRYQELSGSLSKALLDILVGSAQYEQMSDGEKAKAIRDIYESTRKSVRESMTPDLLVPAAEARLRDAARERAMSKATPTPAAVAPAPSSQPSSGAVRSSGPVSPSGGAVQSSGPAGSSGPVVPRP
jgi:soluble lytic murein transglycosylase-like protein